MPDKLTIPDKNDEASCNEASSIKERSIYLLPNLFTTGALFAGFFAIFAVSVGQYERAIMAILIATLLDVMDGRVARLTNTQSQFGAHYDSLSDLISFGVAPALLTFAWQIQGLGKIAWAATFIYGAGAALRLARFNLHCHAAPVKYFIGLPSPAAAITLVSLLWVCYENQWFSDHTSYLLLILLPVLGLLMISNLPYFSFKSINWNKKVSFMVILFLLCFFASLLLEPAFSLLGMSMLYTVSSLVLMLVKTMRLYRLKGKTR